MDELAEVDLAWITETDDAICVSEEEGGQEIWLPKSETEVDGPRIEGQSVTILMPAWLATDRNLI